METKITQVAAELRALADKLERDENLDAIKEEGEYDRSLCIAKAIKIGIPLVENGHRSFTEFSGKFYEAVYGLEDEPDLIEHMKPAYVAIAQMENTDIFEAMDDSKFVRQFVPYTD